MSHSLVRYDDLVFLKYFFMHLWQEASNENEVEMIIRTNPLLKYSKLPLKAPLLALPYGHSQSSRKLYHNYINIPYKTGLECVIASYIFVAD